MKSYIRIVVLTTFIVSCHTVKSQTNSSITDLKLANSSLLKDSITETKQQQIERSIKKARIDSLRKIVSGFPVIANLNDTLFH